MKPVLFLAVALAAAVPSSGLTQPFEPGPPGIVPGSSMSGARIDGAPDPRATPRIPNAPIFGDTAAERAYGREYDDSYPRPRVPRPDGSRRSNEAVATEGRSDLNIVNSGEFATQGPNAIGASPVTRGSSFSRGGRARISR